MIVLSKRSDDLSRGKRLSCSRRCARPLRTEPMPACGRAGEAPCGRAAPLSALWRGAAQIREGLQDPSGHGDQSALRRFPRSLQSAVRPGRAQLLCPAKLRVLGVTWEEANCCGP
ncbi:hypothetical protein AAFF_G00130090 [Aldrovandia affinis]|uniref:Uncharacterized protein n=1 Tax=Aldrovandia affinis TaxID=143900 RepID=A0AAD7RTL5_9TELE|nr:hypothetical protein AAFF_G00130090 [Aldrovandia affinis]